MPSDAEVWLAGGRVTCGCYLSKEPVHAATKIRRLGRKASSGVDRTAYKGHRPLSYVSHHTRAISMGIVRADAWTVFHTTAKIKQEGALSATSARGRAGRTGAARKRRVPKSTRAGRCRVMPRYDSRAVV